MKVTGNMAVAKPDAPHPTYPYLAIKPKDGLVRVYPCGCVLLSECSGIGHAVGASWSWSRGDGMEKKHKFQPLPAGQRIVLENTNGKYNINRDDWVEEDEPE